MDTAWKYIPERKADWADMADSLRQRVSMEDVVRTYLPGTQIRHRRIPCPIHNGKDYNMSLSRGLYKCFVCGAAGDVIGFVGDLLGLDRKDAMRRINQDLNLGLPIDGYVSDELSTALLESRRKALERENTLKKEEEKLSMLWDRWCALDRQLLHGGLSGVERMCVLKRMNIYTKLIDDQENKMWEVRKNG